MTGMTDTDMLTVPEVAARLRVNAATVRRWCADGTLPAIKVGRSYRIEADQLTAVIDTHRTSTPLVLGVTPGRVIV